MCSLNISLHKHRRRVASLLYVRVSHRGQKSFPGCVLLGAGERGRQGNPCQHLADISPMVAIVEERDIPVLVQRVEEVLERAWLFGELKAEESLPRDAVRGPPLHVWVEITGSQKCRIVGKSQSVLIMNDPIISTRTHTV
jgi:hypothetical protein